MTQIAEVQVILFQSQLFTKQTMIFIIIIIVELLRESFMIGDHLPSHFPLLDPLSLASNLDSLDILV